METQIKNLTSAIATLIALQIVTLAVVVGSAFFLRRDLKEQVAMVAGSNSRRDLPDRIEDWEVFEREYNAAQGKKDAEIVMIEYSDFQCPFCKQFSEGTRRKILAAYGDHVRMVFKHFPLDHP